MNPDEVLRIVDAIHRDKNIAKDIVFEGIEQAILSAARKHYGEEEDLFVHIDRTSGEPTVKLDGEAIPQEELEILGRISAQTAKQVMIQKIREAERDSLYDEYEEMRAQLVNGVITRVDQGVATVNLGKVEGLLPRSEQIPGETHRVGERVRCIVLEVRKQGSRVRIILSRSHPELVRRLFEVEIPEVAEGIIQVRSLAREAGYRSKVAVSSYDNNIDCVGACVGVRGSRIRSIVDELAGERIDIVRWNDSLQVLIPNALQPAEVEDVILCPMLGRVIVLVREDQLSLAIGKKGQNVRLGSKLVGWDIEVMTQEELDEQLDRSVQAFVQVPHISDELAESLVSQGFFSFDDLSVIEPDQLREMSGLSEEQCEEIIEYADAESERQEQETERRRKLEREVRVAEARSAELDQMVQTARRAAESVSATADLPSQEAEELAAEAGSDDAAVPESGDETSGQAIHYANEVATESTASDAAEVAAVSEDLVQDSTDTSEESEEAEALEAASADEQSEPPALDSDAAAMTAEAEERRATDEGGGAA